jgi:mono/diheme cytochrome c family protein
MILAAESTQRSIGIIIAVVLVVGWVLYLIGNVRRKGAPEIGSELELAPNRKPYYDDETLEGPRLNRALLAGLLILVVIGVGLPLYALNEPTRQSEATTGFDKRFASWGAADFAPTAQGGFNCAGCHGDAGIGGQADYTFTDPRTGRVRTVTWKAPALNTVLLRFDEDEVKYILTYGRPFSPMSPWGTDGGGPMNDQQLTNIIAYLKSIQLTPEEAKAQVAAGLEEAKKDPANAGKSDGELLFNMSIAGGSYSCARCHTAGFSYGEPQVPGGGAMGPNLTNGDTNRQFPNIADHIAFVENGSETGKRYGQQGQGSGRMPGFAQMMTPEQIQAVVEYERGL